MIKTLAEYKSALDYINTDLEMYDFELSDKMTSYEYNLYLQDIQYYLNMLYEKYRVLEDLSNYLEEYSETKIDNMLKNIKEKEAKLNTSIDKYLSSKSKAFSVKWNTGSLDIIKDRDGKELKKAVYDKDNYLTLDGHKLGKVNINNIVKEEYTQTYSDNLLSCIDDGIYLTSYNVDEPQTSKEILYIDIDNIDNVDSLQLEPINCTIEYKGVTEGKKAIFEISCDALSKTKENFDYSAYVKGQLEETDKKIDYSRAQRKDLKTYIDWSKEQADKKQIEEYKAELANNINTNNNNAKRSEVVATYAKAE